MKGALFIDILKFIMSLHGSSRSRKCCATDVLMKGPWGHDWKFANHTITMYLFIDSIFISDVPVTCCQLAFVHLKHKNSWQIYPRLQNKIQSPNPRVFGQQWLDLWCSEQNWKLEPEILVLVWLRAWIVLSTITVSEQSMCRENNHSDYCCLIFWFLQELSILGSINQKD